MSSLIQLDDVSVSYAGALDPVLRGVNLAIGEGELALVVGGTGTGKSTLLGAITAAVPHFTGGTLQGRVTIAGLDTRHSRPRDLASIVGVVGQDPLAGFVTETVDDELAYAMEQLGVHPAVMRKRVEETLDLLGIADLRGACLRELSGGQAQRVAIAAVLTAHPQILVLDEPTSALDPTGADDVLATVTRLVHDLAVTVVLAEHRIERVLAYADLAIQVGRDGMVTSGPPGQILATSEVAPPVVELGRWAGWEPLPLSVRDARRAATALLAARSSLALADPASEESVMPGPADPRDPVVADRVVVRYGGLVALAGVSTSLRAGEITGLMGRNGSGKSSLLWALQGSGVRTSGGITIAGQDPSALPPGDRRAVVSLVPQSAADLLYLDSVGAECAAADTESRADPGTCRRLLDAMVDSIDAACHPRDLSAGQQLALVLAIQLTAAPKVLLLDEPTRGLDYAAKRSLAGVLAGLREQGRVIAVASHDVEFVAAATDRVIVLAAGEIVADGPTASVVRSSPALAPQVAKITAPSPWLTVADVADAFPRGAP